MTYRTWRPLCEKNWSYSFPVVISLQNLYSPWSLKFILVYIIISSYHYIHRNIITSYCNNDWAKFNWLPRPRFINLLSIILLYIIRQTGKLKLWISGTVTVGQSDSRITYLTASRIWILNLRTDIYTPYISSKNSQMPKKNITTASPLINDSPSAEINDTSPPSLSSLTEKKKPVQRRGFKWCQRYGNSFVLSFQMPGRERTILIIGPHWLGVIVTVCIILGGTTSDYHMIKDSGDHLSAFTRDFFFIFIAVFFVSTISFLFLTAFSDPGIIFPSTAEQSNLEEESAFNLDDIPYCDICSVYQFQHKKIHHCEDCGYCIEGLDHHCPWMGQCIGKKNMKWFILFNLSWLTYFLQLLYTAFVQMKW